MELYQERPELEIKGKKGEKEEQPKNLLTEKKEKKWVASSYLLIEWPSQLLISLRT